MDNAGVLGWALPAEGTRLLETDARQLSVTIAPRNGVGNTIVRLLRFQAIRELLQNTNIVSITNIAQNIEGRIKNEDILIVRADGNHTPASAQDLEAFKRKPVLLLNHGIFSSLKGCFGSLDHTKLLADLISRYGGRVIGYDHWTVSKSPLENALDFLGRLPADANYDLDVVCHSRGSPVTRAMLEHRNTAVVRRNRIRSVGKLIFVAGANHGSVLANRNTYKGLFDTLTILGSLPWLPPWAGISVRLLVGALKMVASGAASLPGISTLVPNSPLLNEINNKPSWPGSPRVTVIRANTNHMTGPLGRVVNFAARRFFNGAANDLVVPYIGAGEFDPGVNPAAEKSFGPGGKEQGDVWHTNFFEQHDVQEWLRQELI